MKDLNLANGLSILALYILSGCNNTVIIVIDRIVPLR